MEDRQARIDELELRLLAQGRELERALQELDGFVYSVSHDLRAPLRVVRGLSQLLVSQDAAGLGDEHRELLARIDANATRMSGMIEDLLRLSRLGRAPLARRRVDLRAIVEEVLAKLRADYPAAAVSVAELPEVTGDAALLRQLFESLLGNALKFSKDAPSAQIEVGAQQSGGETVVRVRDNGAGFDMQFAGRLFGVFQRMHREAEFPGNGVGLAVAKRIVERHGGRIWAESAPGQGATFRFTLQAGGEEPAARG